MNKKKKILPLHNGETHFKVTETYFQQQEAHILNKTIYIDHIKEKLFLYLQTKPADFELVSVDEEYFGSQLKSILQQTTEKSIKWQSIVTEGLYIVPESYFDGLSIRIKEKINPKIAKDQWIWIPGVWREPALALAAIICLVIGIGYYAITNRIFENSQNWSASLQELPKKDIAAYITAHATSEIDIHAISITSWENEMDNTTVNETDVNDLMLIDEM